MCACTEPVRTGIGAVCVEHGRPKWPITMLNYTHKHPWYRIMFGFLFWAPYARTTRYEEAFFSLENQGKKARFARAPHYNMITMCEPGTYFVLYSSSSTAAVVLRRYPDRTRTNNFLTPLKSSHRYHRPAYFEVCRLCARSSRTLLFRPQARGDSTRMPSVLGESRSSCQLSSWAGSEAYRNGSTSIPVYELFARARRQLLMVHIHRIVPPRCRSESSWLRAGRVWACTRPLQSVYATAGLVYRRFVVVLVYDTSTACCCWAGSVIYDTL